MRDLVVLLTVVLLCPRNADGDDIQVNTYTTNSQLSPSVSLDTDGDFVVVWASNGSDGTDSEGYSIQRSESATVPVELQTFSID